MRVCILLLVCGFAVASAARYDDDFDFDLDDQKKTTDKRTIIETIIDGFHIALERIKARLDKSKDLAAEFGDRLKEITKKVTEIGKAFNADTMRTLQEMNRKIRDLTLDVAKRIAGRGSRAVKRSVEREMHDLFVKIKAIIMTDAGMKEVRNHIRNMRTSHPLLLLVRNYIENADDSHLKEILGEFFKDLQSFRARYATELEQLFQRVGKLLRTDEGFDALYNYMVNIRSNHPLVAQLHMVLVAEDKDDVRDLLEELIDAFEH